MFTARINIGINVDKKKCKTKYMEAVKNGDVVKVNYTGKLMDGEQFDSSEGREPLEFTVGAGQMIKGFDDAMPGMIVGEKKTINILPADAYGEKDDAAIMAFPKADIPSGILLEAGTKLQLKNEHGDPIPVSIIEVKEDFVMLDANHHLAGKELVFDIELVEIISVE